MNWLVNILMFLPVCFITSVVCATLKKEENESVAAGTIRMFMFLSLGIAAFCLLIYAITRIAGAEYLDVW